MARKEQKVLKEAELTNHCPACYNPGMKLTFFQKHHYGLLYSKVLGELHHEIRCKKCESVIYPVDWNEDIERVFDYYHKMVEPAKKSIRFTTLFYILALVLVILVAVACYWLLNR